MQILAETGKITGGEVRFHGEDITKWNSKQMQKRKMLHHFPGSDDQLKPGIYRWKPAD